MLELSKACGNPVKRKFSEKHRVLAEEHRAGGPALVSVTQNADTDEHIAEAN